MDEKRFKMWLKSKEKKLATINAYVHAVKRFEKWLFRYRKKRLNQANENDLHAWKDLTKNPVNPHGIREYYRCVGDKDELVKMITDKIIPKIRKPPPSRVLSWDNFRDIMRKAEENGTEREKLALLNLLWSEMKPKKILELRKSDINFEKRLITCHGKTHHLIRETWDVLQKHVPKKDRGKNERLFKIGSVRTVEKITEKVFESVGKTPHDLKKSYRKDLIEAGKTVRLDYGEHKETSLKEEKEPEEEIEVGRNLFDRLIPEIRKFGRSKWIHNQIPKLEGREGERELQRLLEGYLLATFPDEVITDEFRFKGDEKGVRRMDITIGDPKIPVEVKVAESARDMREVSGKGFTQVKEFLENFGSKKGVLVIGDKKRDPERMRKHSRVQKFNHFQVYVIVI